MLLMSSDPIPESMAASRWFLGIHTVTSTLGLALVPMADRSQAQSQLYHDPDGLYRSQSARAHCWPLDRDMAAQLHPCLAEFLLPQTWSDLAGIAVAVGPGSFTGCRMGVTVARTLGQALDLPVYGISSLASVAASHRVQHLEVPDPSPVLAIEMDAKRGEIYAGAYRIHWVAKPFELASEALIPDQLWTPQAWEAEIEALTQSGLTCIQIQAGVLKDPDLVLALTGLAIHSYRQGQIPVWSDVIPQYGRQPPIHMGIEKRGGTV